MPINDINWELAQLRMDAQQQIAITTLAKTLKKIDTRLKRLESAIAIDEGDDIVIKVGSASITMKKDGTIQVKGKDIRIDGSGTITVKASGDVTLRGSKVSQN